jgi:hypothetical protein
MKKCNYSLLSGNMPRGKKSLKLQPYGASIEHNISYYIDEKGNIKRGTGKRR